jgi:hypothetical protein
MGGSFPDDEVCPTDSVLPRAKDWHIFDVMVLRESQQMNSSIHGFDQRFEQQVQKLI